MEYNERNTQSVLNLQYVAIGKHIWVLQSGTTNDNSRNSGTSCMRYSSKRLGRCLAWLTSLGTDVQNLLLLLLLLLLLH
jgi:hypothetical protein